jgi:hypothetical protein
MKPTGLVGKTVQESVAVFPPFSSAYGENLTPGKDIVINTGCSFQDTGRHHHRGRHAHRPQRHPDKAQPGDRHRPAG